MTPIGHLSVSYLAGKINRRLCFPAILFGGVFPDIDYVLLLHPAFNQMHRMVTHNLLFLGAASVLLAVLVGTDSRKSVLFSFFLGGLLHLLVDSCLDANPSNGIGIALLWPFSDVYVSPFNLLQPVTGSPGWRAPLQMMKAVISGFIWELPFILMALIVVFKKSILKNPDDN